MTESPKQPQALVSGASGGIGAAICRHLVDAGYRVIGSARDSASLRDLQRQLGERFHAITLDVTDAVAVRDIANRLPSDCRNNRPGFRSDRL